MVSTQISDPQLRYRIQALDQQRSPPEWHDIQVIWDSEIGHAWAYLTPSTTLYYCTETLDHAIGVAREMTEGSPQRMRIVDDTTGGTVFDTDWS